MKMPDGVDLTVPGAPFMTRRVELRTFLMRHRSALPKPELLPAPADDPEALAGWVLTVFKEIMWRPASRPPEPGNCRLGEPITVLGVVDDPMYQVAGEAPFVDVVHYWPHEQRWTITHCSRADTDAADHPVKVVQWKPLDQIPPPWSDLWA